MLLDADLRSPCTEEIAVFRAFSTVVNQDRRRCVVMDTAPTGRTLPWRCRDQVVRASRISRTWADVGTRP